MSAKTRCLNKAHVLAKCEATQPPGASAGLGRPRQAMAARHRGLFWALIQPQHGEP